LGVDIRGNNHVNYNKYILVLEYYRWSGKLSVPDEDRGNSLVGTLCSSLKWFGCWRAFCHGWLA
jgi:hypothetical protein